MSKLSVITYVRAGRRADGDANQPLPLSTQLDSTNINMQQVCVILLEGLSKDFLRGLICQEPAKLQNQVSVQVENIKRQTVSHIKLHVIIHLSMLVTLSLLQYFIDISCMYHWSFN